MENYIDKLLVLEDSYKCPIKELTLNRLFGKEQVREFLSKNNQYKRKDGWVGRGESFENFRNIRESERKIEKAQKYLWIFRFISWIKFAAITGDVAYGSASKSGDIDLFLVVQDKRLWITRGIELVIFSLIGVRRLTWRKDIQDKFCINYYTSDKNLNLKSGKGSEFLTALEIAMMKPIYNKDYYRYVLSENNWIRKYFPNLKFSVKRRMSVRVFGLSHLLDFLDWLAMKMQIVFMKIMKHSTKNSMISRNRITFFDRNSQWQKRGEML